ncbi:MAG: ABC transporter permease [Propionibacteriaceae bacterium]|nr:ABC transporter permease [Propionibacteriaceae bacterium]
MTTAPWHTDPTGFSDAAAPAQTLFDASAVSRPWRLSFGGLLVAEWRKLATMTSTWVLLGLGVVLGLFTTGAGASTLTAMNQTFSGPAAPMTPPIGRVSMALVGGPIYPGLMMALLGVLAITNEYSSGMIRATLAAAPSRWPALAAKAVIVTGFSFVSTVVAEFIGALIAWGTLGNGVRFDLFTPDGLQVWFGSSLDVTLLALMGLSVGVLVRGTAGAVVTQLLGLMLALPVLILMIAGLAASSGQDVSNGMLTLVMHCPTVAAVFVYLGPIVGRDTLASVSELPSATSAVLTMLAWTAVLLAGAFAVFRRRDV